MNAVKIATFAKDVELFNQLAGNLDSPSMNDVRKQCILIQEELSETIGSAGDPEELLDGCVDVLVTALGLAQMLSKMGFNVEEALDRVAQNNLTKFPKDETTAAYTEHYFNEAGTPVVCSYNEEYEVWVCKDENGKVRKPIGYKSVSLDGLFPEVVA